MIARFAPLFVAAAASWALFRVQAPELGGDEKAVMRTLHALVHDGVPNPIGSAENDSHRALIMRELEGLGYRVEAQDRFVCSEIGACGRPRNLIAVRKGRRLADQVVLVVAHYDSVGAGPGAWDNSVGVAVVLAAARELAAGEALARSVMFLLDDGEEAGVLGAQAFAQDHPVMAAVRVVVNVDGMSGLSAVSIDGVGRAGIAEVIGPRLERPFISSAWDYLDELGGGFDDSRVFLAAGVPVVGVRGLSGASIYHTRLDASDTLDAATVLHKARLTTAVVRALADAPDAADAAVARDERAVFFDVASAFVVTSSQVTWCVLAGLALASLLLSARKRFRSRTFAGCAVALIVGTGAGLAAALAFRSIPAMVASIAAATFVVLMRVQRDVVDTIESAITVWTPVALLGLAAAIFAPELAYIFVLPALAAAIAVRAKSAALAAIAPGVLLAIALAPIAHVIHELAGFDQAKKLAAITAVLCVSTAPAFVAWSRRAARGLIAALLILFVATAIATRAASRERASLRFEHDASARSSRWIYSGHYAFAGSKRVAKPYPWSSGTRPAFIASSTITRGPPPRLELLSRETRTSTLETIRARLISARSAAQATLAIPPGTPIIAVRIEGENVALAESNVRSSNGYRLITVYGLDALGGSVIVELDVAAPSQPIELVLFDVSYGAPASGAPATSTNRLPRDMGDSTSVLVQTKL